MQMIWVLSWNVVLLVNNAIFMFDESADEFTVATLLLPMMQLVIFLLQQEHLQLQL